MSNYVIYDSWSEHNNDGHLITVTDAPLGLRLVDADDYDKLQAESDRFQKALKEISLLDYANASINGAVYKAVTIATNALKGSDNE